MVGWALVPDTHFFSPSTKTLARQLAAAGRTSTVQRYHVCMSSSSRSRVPAESSQVLRKDRPCHRRTLLSSKQTKTKRPKLEDRGSRRGFFLVSFTCLMTTHPLSLVSVKLPRRWLARANEALHFPMVVPTTVPVYIGILSVRAVIPGLHVHL